MEQSTLPKPVDWDELYPGRFLKSGDLKGKKVTLRIAAIDLDELIGDKGAKIKGVITFSEDKRQLALNKTNGICLRAMFGRKVQEWVGKRVTLFPAQWNGEDCIRLFGSPEIEKDIVVQVALPRRRPFEMTMHATGSAKTPAPALHSAWESAARTRSETHQFPASHAGETRFLSSLGDWCATLIELSDTAAPADVLHANIKTYDWACSNRTAADDVAHLDALREHFNGVGVSGL